MTEIADNGKPIESVWDYPRPPRLEAVDHLVEVSHHGVVIARSTRCMRVLETSQPPAYYIPETDIAADLLRPSAATTYCEWKGPAAYADVVIHAAAGSDATSPDATSPAEISPEKIIVADAAWTYRSPTKAFSELLGHWAFYAQKLGSCTIDGESVDPNAGSFYGGWITSNITGPFKGAPGTGHW